MARTFPRESLPSAMAMEKAGRSADEIWQANRLARAANGRWAFEIPDAGYQVRPNATEAAMLKSPAIAPLYEHHRHLGMREAYPRLSNWKSHLIINPLIDPYGETDFKRKRMLVRAPNLQWARSVGIHELQHLIDWLEKHAPGGSPRQFTDLGIPEQEAYDLYHRLIGEVVARNAQQRLYLNDRMRSLLPPQATEDVPRHRQINLYDYQ